jgi:hypothetical protein
MNGLAAIKVAKPFFNLHNNTKIHTPYEHPLERNP